VRGAHGNAQEVYSLPKGKELWARTPPDYFQCFLLDDSSALCANIQVVPSHCRLHLITFAVACEQAVGIGCISADTNPRFVDSNLVGDVFAGIVHRFQYAGETPDVKSVSVISDSFSARDSPVGS